MAKPGPPPVSNKVSFSIAALDAVTSEGDSGTTEFTFTVTRTNASGRASVDYTVTGASTDADASDFVGGSFPSGTITFARGETSQTIIIQVAGDTTVEPNESFNIALSNPHGGTIANATATGIIQNDDAPNIVQDTPKTNETLSGTNGADYFVFDALQNDDNPDWSSGGHVQSDTIEGFEQGVDKLVFVDANYALVGHQEFDAHWVYYNNDIGGTDWDSDVRVYDQQGNPVALTQSDFFII
jgi:hypothetical protein